MVWKHVVIAPMSYQLCRACWPNRRSVVRLAVARGGDELELPLAGVLGVVGGDGEDGVNPEGDYVNSLRQPAVFREVVEGAQQQQHRRISPKAADGRAGASGHVRRRSAMRRHAAL